jgi:lipopolysaccharide/colanic/teichoic acid biosynthesis glycosyltransferase
MARRLLDILLCSAALVFFLPVFLFAAAGILLSSKGPIIYKSRRIGLNGKSFTMYKFRSMHEVQPHKSPITSVNDSRVYRFGSFLRRSKIDELPQLWNVLKGQMSIVGPRPEAPEIVENCYTVDQLETLKIMPGLTSPGSLFDYIYGDVLLAGDDAEKAYVDKLLPIKLELDAYYMRHKSLAYDLK